MAAPRRSSQPDVAGGAPSTSAYPPATFAPPPNGFMMPPTAPPNGFRVPSTAPHQFYPTVYPHQGGQPHAIMPGLNAHPYSANSQLAMPLPPPPPSWGTAPHPTHPTGFPIYQMPPPPPPASTFQQPAPIAMSAQSHEPVRPLMPSSAPSFSRPSPAAGLAPDRTMSDKEEGELSEDDPHAASLAGRPDPPRSVPPTRAALGDQPGQRADNVAAALSDTPAAMQQPDEQDEASLQAGWEESKRIVRILYRCGNGFDVIRRLEQFKDLDNDQEELAKLFRDAGLPLDPAPNIVEASNNRPQAANTIPPLAVATDSGPRPSEAQRYGSATTAQPTHASETSETHTVNRAGGDMVMAQNRQAYIARLQAAKSSKAAAAPAEDEAAQLVNATLPLSSVSTEVESSGQATTSHTAGRTGPGFSSTQQTESVRPEVQVDLAAPSAHTEATTQIGAGLPIQLPPAAGNAHMTDSVALNGLATSNGPVGFASVDSASIAARRASSIRRPLGASPDEADYEKVVIDCSDGESDLGMNPDETHSARPASAVQSVSSVRIAAPHLPGLQSVSARPTSAASAVSVTTFGSAAHLNSLGEKEAAIAKMRLKIAELEQKKAIKRKQPQSKDFTADDPVRDANTPLPATQAEVEALTSPTAPMQHVGESDWKQKRRAEIQRDWLALDAELVNSANRLEQIRKEAQQIEADNRERLQEKEALYQELNRLGRMANGILGHTTEDTSGQTSGAFSNGNMAATSVDPASRIDQINAHGRMRAQRSTSSLYDHPAGAAMADPQSPASGAMDISDNESVGPHDDSRQANQIPISTSERVGQGTGPRAASDGQGQDDLVDDEDDLYAPAARTGIEAPPNVQQAEPPQGQYAMPDAPDGSEMDIASSEDEVYTSKPIAVISQPTSTQEVILTDLGQATGHTSDASAAFSETQANEADAAALSMVISASPAGEPLSGPATGAMGDVGEPRFEHGAQTKLYLAHEGESKADGVGPARVDNNVALDAAEVSFQP